MISLYGMAQPQLRDQPDPCGDPNNYDPCCLYGEKDPRCPVDGGVVALLAAGVGYGIKKVRDSRKKEVVEG